MFMDMLAWLIIGGVAGWLASVVMKTDSRQGLIMDIVVGIIGAFIGGYVLNFFGVVSDAGNFNFTSFVTAFVGAIILLGILKLVRR